MSLEYLTCNLIATRRIRRDTLDDKPHLVVPTVMVVEGVLNGTNGPLLYPASELSKTPSVWNHKPLVVNHPQDGSACRPEVLNRRKIGVILNTSWESPKLRTEAWIDVAAANRVDKRIIENLEASRKVEVSTGLYVDMEHQSGQFGGKSYNAIARNYRPDHLAVLPDMVGACSVQDGAGMLQLNQQRIATTVIPHSPTYAVINLSDGTFYPIEGDATYVQRRVTEALNGLFIPSLAECIDPLKNFASLLPSTQGPVLMSQTPANVHNVDDLDMTMPTINWATGQIERNGKPIPERVQRRTSTMVDDLLTVWGNAPQAGIVANAGIEVNEKPYVRPTMNFDDRLATHQPSKPVENEHAQGEENEKPYLRPKLW